MSTSKILLPIYIGQGHPDHGDGPKVRLSPPLSSFGQPQMYGIPTQYLHNSTLAITMSLDSLFDNGIDCHRSALSAKCDYLQNLISRKSCCTLFDNEIYLVAPSLFQWKEVQAPTLLSSSSCSLLTAIKSFSSPALDPTWVPRQFWTVASLISTSQKVYGIEISNEINFWSHIWYLPWSHVHYEKTG